MCTISLDVVVCYYMYYTMCTYLITVGLPKALKLTVTNYK